MVSRSLTVAVGWAAFLCGGACAWANQIPPPLMVGGERAVLVDGQAKSPRFLKIGSGQVVQTVSGRATLLPRFNVVVTMDKESSVTVFDSSECEINSGSVSVHVLRNHLDFALRYKDAVVTLDRKGWYRVDAGSGTLRVYRGDAMVAAANKTIRVAEDRRVELNGGLASSRLDAADRDAFFRTMKGADHGILATVPCLGQVFDGGGRLAGSPTDNNQYCQDPELPPTAP